MNPQPASGALRALSDAEWTVLEEARQLKARPAMPAVTKLAGEPALRVDGHIGLFEDCDRRWASRAPSRSLAEVLDARCSETAALGKFARSDLAALLYRSARLITPGRGEDGGPWSHRPAPSAGATHPFDVLVCARSVEGLPEGHYVFAPFGVQLLPLARDQVPFADAVETAATAAARRKIPAPATIGLIANVHRVRRRYPTPLTLLLRDAGALLTLMHLVAADLGMNSSIVGLAGQVPDEQERTAYAARPLIVSAGGLVVGGKP